MSKSRLLILACAALAVVMSVIVSAAPQDDAVRIASLVNDMKSMDFTQLKSLQPVTVKPHTLPGPSVDVMRVQLEETYAVEGIGKDTVELNGWIAVRHGASRPAPGEKIVSWETAVTDTEFVGMELRGQSSIFGPVKVTLDSSRPAIGQVGSQVSIPEQANQIILAANEGAQTAPQGDTDAGTACRAPVNVKVAMSDLNIEMITKTPAVWYSRVTTIPPVGHVASVAVEPVSLTSAGREVGTLVSGSVKFREVVRAVSLSPNHQVVIAP